MKFQSSSFLFICWLSCCALFQVSAAEDAGPLANIREKYDAMSDKGKMAAGAAVGFVGSRLALRSVVGAAKIAGAAYIAAEVLERTGVMENLPAISDEQDDLIKKVKDSTMRRVHSYRTQIRRQLSRDGVQGFMETEKMAAFGLAGGAFAGLIL